MSPEVPQYKDDHQPVVKDNRGLVNVDFEGTSLLFGIAVTALLIALFLGMCCHSMRCTIATWRKKKEQM